MKNVIVIVSEGDCTEGNWPRKPATTTVKHSISIVRFYFNAQQFKRNGLLINFLVLQEKILEIH